MPRSKQAYTVGNPDSYEPFLDKDPCATKAVGGIVFLTREAAEETVKNGFLPTEWFGELKLPGRVYGLVDAEFEESVDGFSLTSPAKLVRV